MPTPAIMERVTGVIRIQNDLIRCFLAEFLGIFVICGVADAGLAQVILNKLGIAENTVWLSLSLGLAVGFGIYTGFGVSGGHHNPTVTISVAALGKFPWRRVPVYFLAQFCGAFVGAAIVYLVYYEALASFDGDYSLTATIFTTSPMPYISLWSGFLDQIVNSGFLMLMSMAIFDQKNCGVPNHLIPLLIGLIVTTIILTYSMNTGAPLNPARDLSGRLFAWMVGHGSDVWLHNGKHWWWIPTFGPLIGGTIGGWIYFLLVEAHHPTGETSSQSNVDVEITKVSAVYNNDAYDKEDLKLQARDGAHLR